MPSFLDRYNKGEHEEVWRELTAMGTSIAALAVWEDAVSVGWETMRRVSTNIDTIIERLTESGYVFARPQRLHLPPDPDADTYLEIIEKKCGKVPVSLMCWYKVVGSVNLTGSHPDWPLSANYDVDRRTPLQFLYTDALVVSSLAPIAMEVEDLDEDGIFIDGTPWITLGPDVGHKVGESGAEERIMISSSMDGLLWDASGRPMFVDYLRKSLRWGGLPGMERYCNQFPDLCGFAKRLGSDLIPF